MSRSRTDRGSRKSVALLVDHLGGDYQIGLLRAVEDAGRARDTNLLVVPGRSLRAPNPAEAAQNDVYTKIGRKRVDGVIVATGTLCGHVDAPTLAEFFASFEGVARCSVSANVPGVPSVAVSNRRGMRIVVEHLIETHGCRRIGYIRGPSGGTEGQERFEGYAAALHGRGLALDGALVQCGDFRMGTGADAVRRLLGTNIPMDALVAANDYMALGALGELRARGQHVPQGLLVAGFDDVPLARIASPSLTTVRQPLQRLGMTSMETVLRQIAGERVEQSVELDIELVTRQSCGCAHAAMHRHPTPRRVSVAGVYETQARDVLHAIETKSDALSEAMRRCIPVPAAVWTNWFERLMSALRAEFAGSDGALLLELGDILDEAQGFGDAVHRFVPVIGRWRDVMRHGLLDLSNLCLLDDLWYSATLLVEAAVERNHQRLVFESEREQEAMRESIERLSTALSVPALTSALEVVLPALGIRGGVVSTYEDDTRLLRPLLAVGDGFAGDPSDDPVPARRLAPDACFPADRRWSHVVLPLSLGTEHLGLALFQGGGPPTAYRMLREQISTTLKLCGVA